MTLKEASELTVEVVEAVEPLDLSGRVEVVPGWLLGQITRSRGRRGEQPYPKFCATTYYQPTSGSAWPPAVVMKRRPSLPATTPTGNLDGDDYRFWVGHEVATVIEARCRWCGQFFYGKDSRRTHFKKETNCSHLLRAVFEMARAESQPKCFWCYKVTYKLKWGFPLCENPECLYGWMFKGTSGALGFAGAVHKARVGGLLKGWLDLPNQPKFRMVY